MYFGKSVTIVKKPQSWPIWATTSAQTGAEVKIARHGIFFLPFDTLPAKHGVTYRLVRHRERESCYM